MFNLTLCSSKIQRKNPRFLRFLGQVRTRLKPSDSVSNIGSRDSHSGSVVSRKSRSKRSVASSGLSSRNSAMRVIVAAKKAVLEAEETQLESFKLKDGGPYTMRTVLGWTVNGPLGRKGTCI